MDMEFEAEAALERLLDAGYTKAQIREGEHMSDKKTEKRTRRPRQSGGFAVAFEAIHEGEPALVLLADGLPDTAAAEAWLRKNGKPASTYTIMQLKRQGVKVAVEEVRRARLV